MTSILGLDISSVQLNACLLIDGQPPVLRSERLGKPTDPLIERLRKIPEAVWSMHTLPDHIDADGYTAYVDWLVVEDAFGRNRNADRALNRTIGAIIASAHHETQIATLSTGDWRRAIGAANTKIAGHHAVIDTFIANGWEAPPNVDEHQLDCTGITLAWASILAQNEAA